MYILSLSLVKNLQGRPKCEPQSFWPSVVAQWHFFYCCEEKQLVFTLNGTLAFIFRPRLVSANGQGLVSSLILEALKATDFRARLS